MIAGGLSFDLHILDVIKKELHISELAILAETFFKFGFLETAEILLGLTYERLGEEIYKTQSSEMPGDHLSMPD